MGGAVSIERSDETRLSGADQATRFRAFCADVEPRLRRALIAAYGAELGSDAAAEALTWAWEHFGRVEHMANPGGYLWRIGQTATRRELRHGRRQSTGDAEERVWPSGDFEPGLSAPIASLSSRQRVAVLLVHGYGYSLTEAAAQMDCRVRTLRNHLERGMHKLRADLGVDDHA